MLKPILLATALSVATLPAIAEPLNYNIVEFSESANVQVPRDTMTVHFYVHSEGSNRSAVNSNFIKKFNSLNRQIAANHRFQATLLNRNATPRYQYTNGKRTQIGWEETANIQVQSEDFTALNQLIAQAQSWADLQSTSFSVSKKKREAAIDEVSKAALLRFKDRANTLAHTLGFSGYKIVRLDLGQIGNQSMEYAAPMALRAAKVDNSMSAPEIDNSNPGTESIQITVNGTIQM